MQTGSTTHTPEGTMSTDTTKTGMLGKLVVVEQDGNSDILGLLTRISDTAITVHTATDGAIVIFHEDYRNVRIALGREVDAEWRRAIKIANEKYALSA